MIDYELQTPFKYAHKGEMVDAIFIRLNPPTSKNMPECADLKQAFFRSLQGAEGRQDKSAEESDKDVEAEDVVHLIAMSKDVELKSVLLTARKLFCSGVASVDGETKVTNPILDEMTQEDLELMLGTYMVFFILASVLKKLKHL